MFIKLTRYDIVSGAAQGAVYLNPDKIESIGLSRKGTRTICTVVSMGHGKEYIVKEPIEEILGQINQVAQEELLPKIDLSTAQEELLQKIRFINGEPVEVRG